jgi:hypothetical protein
MAVKKNISAEPKKRAPKPPAKMGRPEKPIDWRQVEAMCQIQCTQAEICAIVGVSDETINARCKKEHGMTFLEYFSQKREGGRASLRRRGWKLAETTPSVWIFHAKNYLGMSDNPGDGTGDQELTSSTIE